MAITKYLYSSNAIAFERLIHSIKTVIACIIGFILTITLPFTRDPWIVITIIVVMCAQIYVGSVLQKATLRFLGTLLGCAFAILMLKLIGHTNAAIILTLSITGFLFSYLATSYEKFGQAATLGAVTTTIIILSTNPTVDIAVHRLIQISLGIFIATLVSQFVLPIHARTHLRRAQAQTFQQLIDYFQATMTTNQTEISEINYQELDEKAVVTLLKQRQLAKESQREPLGIAFDPKQFMKTLHAEKKILRAINLMHTAMIHINNIDQIFSKSATIREFNKLIITALNTFIKVVETDQAKNEIITLPKLDILTAIFERQPTTSQENYFYINGFLFSADVLLKNLAKLAEQYNVQIIN